MKITKDMVDNCNEGLSLLNCSFKLELNEEEYNPSCKIVPSNNLFIDSSIINLNKKFYEELNTFFQNNGIELKYNNTMSIFWSRFGYTD